MPCLEKALGSHRPAWAPSYGNLRIPGTASEQALLTSAFKWLIEVFANTPFAKVSHMANSVSHDGEKEYVKSKAECIQAQRDFAAILQSITIMICCLCFTCYFTHPENKEVVTILSHEHAFFKNPMITFCKMSPMGIVTNPVAFRWKKNTFRT